VSLQEAHPALAPVAPQPVAVCAARCAVGLRGQSPGWWCGICSIMRLAISKISAMLPR